MLWPTSDLCVSPDPANDVLPYTPGVDISELIELEDVMEAQGLGQWSSSLCVRDVGCQSKLKSSSFIRDETQNLIGRSVLDWNLRSVTQI